MADILPSRTIGIVRARRVASEQEKPPPIVIDKRPTNDFNSFYGLATDDASSSSLSNAKSSEVTPDDSPRNVIIAESAHPKSRLNVSYNMDKEERKRRARAKGLSLSNHRNVDDSNKVLLTKLAELKTRNKKPPSIVLASKQRKGSLADDDEKSDTSSTLYSAELCSIETAVLVSGAKTERDILQLPTSTLAPSHHSAPVSTRLESTQSSRPICPKCHQNEFVARLGYWADRRQEVYYCSNEIPLHIYQKQEEDKKKKYAALAQSANPTKSLVDQFYIESFGPTRPFQTPKKSTLLPPIIELFDSTSLTTATTEPEQRPSKKHKHFSLFRSTPAVSKKTESLKRERKNTKSKSVDFIAEPEEPTPIPNDFIVCGGVWMPNLMYHQIEKVIMQYSYKDQRLVATLFE